jgi:hypothetical protein
MLLNLYAPEQASILPTNIEIQIHTAHRHVTSTSAPSLLVSQQSLNRALRIETVRYITFGKCHGTRNQLYTYPKSTQAAHSWH